MVIKKTTEKLSKVNCFFFFFFAWSVNPPPPLKKTAALPLEKTPAKGR